MSDREKSPGDETTTESWLSDPKHRARLLQDAHRQIEFFRKSLRNDGGYDVLAGDGTPLPRTPQELHTTTRMVHSYAMAKLLGVENCDDLIDAGMTFLWTHHRDRAQGGYFWSIEGDGPANSQKLAYGHVFTLLAGASAKTVNHPDADRLIADISEVIETRFWDDEAGLLREEFNADWTPFSTYRGYNSNMHGTEAFLAAYEATGEEHYLTKAGRILSFFVDQIAPAHSWRLPEHFTESWDIDFDYAGDPMFRPQGTTPGHSLEIARLGLQHWDLAGRPEGPRKNNSRKLIETALDDAWNPKGGLAYTLDYAGQVQIADRYWWPLAEAIGAVSTLLKIEHREQDELWYRRLWTTAADLFIDFEKGGWFPEIDAEGAVASGQFFGKPDIYHALQADLIPLCDGISGTMEALRKFR